MGATELEHVVQVIVGDDRLCYRAECSCGWASEWFEGDDYAEAAGLDHSEVAGQ